MEQIVQILGKLNIPGIGLIIAIITIFIQVKPVTLITSNGLERRLSSKELRVSYSIFSHLLQTFFYSLIVIAITDILSQVPSKLFLWIDLLFLIVIIYLLFKFGKLFQLNENGERYTVSTKKKENIKFLISLFVYIFGWLVTISYSIRRFIYKDFISLINESKEYLIVYFIFVFIVSLILPFLFKPLFKYIEITPSIDYYFEEDDKEIKRKWYILHPINKEEFLLGNRESSFISDEFKVCKRDTLINSLIKSEKNSSLPDDVKNK